MNFHCPICGSPTDSMKHPEFPFCSDRCRIFDLANWAAERYTISEPAFDEADSGRMDAPSSTFHDSGN